MKSMMNLLQLTIKGIIYCFISSIIFLSNLTMLSAEDINWTEVSNSDNEIQFIDTNSIKYNNKDLLSVIIKYAKIDPKDQQIINSNSYLMAIDCKNRLFSKLPINAELKQVKNWTNPINDKLIKKTILNTCSY